MELSLFSRDVIAQATAVSLSHHMFDAVLMLGICDKIVPGLLMGALQFGHLPTLVCAGRAHDVGPCQIKRKCGSGNSMPRANWIARPCWRRRWPLTTARAPAPSTALPTRIKWFSKRWVLQLPGSSFVNPDTPLRDALTVAAAEHVAMMARTTHQPLPLAEVIDERSFVNAIVALLASGWIDESLYPPGGHCTFAAGLVITWSDFDALSRITPLLAKVYPNGSADINHFQAAGGTGLLFGELIKAGLMHGDASCLFWWKLSRQRVLSLSLKRAVCGGDPRADQSLDPEVIRPRMPVHFIPKAVSGYLRVIWAGVSSRHPRWRPNDKA